MAKKFVDPGTFVPMERFGRKDVWEGNPVPYYDFCLIGGDGARLRRERHLAADLETVWRRVFRMAEFESERGKQIQVLDDQGRIVIGIGSKAAALSAQYSRMLRDRSSGEWREGCRTP